MTNHSLKLKKITLKNFIGIRNGLGKSELTINFSKLLDKDIIIILGDNGTGKSTLASVLHALPGTTDKRNKFIIEDKEGMKKIWYERDDGTEYECKLVYSPSKTGHNTKGYITKIGNNTDPVELNPNGNISSYKEVLEEELGLTDAILKLANQNDVCKGHVDMTSTERKVNMTSFLPEDIYSNYFAIVDKTYREMKTRITVLVEAIGKMHDDATIERELKSTTEKINLLVSKRDKCIGKIKELETRIDILKDENIIKREKEIDSNIRSLNKELDKIREKLESLYRDKLVKVLSSGNDTSKNITKVLDELKSKSQQNEIDISIISNSIAALKDKRNSISKDIASKQAILEDINTDLSLNELKDMLSKYKARYKELDKSISKLDTNVSKSDFMVGYDIINTIRNYIDSIREYDYDLVMEALSIDKEELERKLSKLSEKKDRLLELNHNIDSKLSNLYSNNSNLKDILDKRPSECKIDNCPFIINAQKWNSIEKELEDLSKALSESNIKLSDIDKELSRYNDINNILIKINQLINYVQTNLPVISKLPYSDKYSSEKGILKAIEKGSSYLSGCDDFDEFIEILEFKEEYNTLQYKTIPSIENEIKIIETQGKFIFNAKDDLKKLEKSYDEVKSEISDKENKLSILIDTLDYTKSVIESLSLYYEKRSDYEDIYEEMKQAFDELKSVKSKLDEMDEYKEKLKDKKDKLRDIDNDLQPLTRMRELYKMEQLKIADHKQELASIEDDMFKCEIIRDSLSVKGNGIPVGALEYFMDIVRNNANVMLSNAFNGALYLEEFIINSKDFIIPYKKNGDRGMDVSFASSSERSFISLCLTLAIIEETVSKYGIVILDEIDRGFADNAKYKFIDILGTQIRRIGIKQVFMVSHNYSFYEGYDIGYLCFPGSNLTNKDEDSIIEIK